MCVQAQNADVPPEPVDSQEYNAIRIHIMGAFTDASISAGNPDAERQAIELLKFSEDKQSETGIADAYLRFGKIYSKKRQPERARYYFQKAKDLYQRNGNWNGMATVIDQEARIDMQANRPEAALQKYQTALALVEEAGSKDAQVSILQSMGLLFLSLHNYTDAETYLQQALDIATETWQLEKAMWLEIDLGNLYREQKKVPEAQARYEHCLNLLKQVQYPDVSASCKTNLANLYTLQGKYDLALRMYEEPSAYYRQSGDSLQWASLLGFKAEALAHKGMHAPAIDSLHYALALVEHGISLEALKLKSHLSRELYALYRQTGQFEKALEAYEQYNRYEKMIFSEKTANKIAELKEKYQTGQKEQENLALKRNGEIQDLRLKNQRDQIYFLALLAAIIAIVIAGTAILLVRNNKIRLERQNMALEQRLLRSQMNPHFIFNALIAIQSFMYKNETKDAGRFLSSFARLMRSILENSREEFIPLAKEMQWLQNYVKLQQLRFENEIDCHIELDDQLDVENTWIPPMLVQPFIENALEHGLSKTDSHGRLTVSYTRKQDGLAIHIRDNGDGFDPAAALKSGKEHTSVAIEITRERLRLLNRGRKQKIDFHIFSEPGAGTTVSFSIPLMTR